VIFIIKLSFLFPRGISNFENPANKKVPSDTIGIKRDERTILFTRGSTLIKGICLSISFRLHYDDNGITGTLIHAHSEVVFGCCFVKMLSANAFLSETAHSVLFSSTRWFMKLEISIAPKKGFCQLQSLTSRFSVYLFSYLSFTVFLIFHILETELQNQKEVFHG